MKPRLHIWLCLLLALSGGCKLFRKPKSEEEAANEKLIGAIEELDARRVGDFARPQGLRPLKLESIGMVNGLHGTGSDPAPSSQRSVLLSEMQNRQVRKPALVLRSPDTSMVVTRAFLPPGVRRGDRVDVEVRASIRSETKSLRHGWLMETRMKEMAVLDNAIHTGRVYVTAEGPIVVDAAFYDEDTKAHLVRGRVLGGGVSLTDRPIGLVIRSEMHSVKTSARLGEVINRRFFSYDKGVKKGVATPKRDNFLELRIPSLYRYNLSRYIDVVQHIMVREKPAERVERLRSLEQQLLDPATTKKAAIELEAVGKDGIPILTVGMDSNDPQVRFHSAQALAYLDVKEAAEPLTEAAMNHPAFRWNAVVALTSLVRVEANEGLHRLLQSTSAETRYAAFRALYLRNPNDPMIRGEAVKDHKFHIHQVAPQSEPMVHIARSRRPEIVLFGPSMRLDHIDFLNVGPNMMVKRLDDGRCKTIRFQAGADDIEVTSSAELSEVLKSIAEAGGDYEEAMQALRHAKEQNLLPGRLAVDALPKPGRKYRGEPIPQIFENHLAEKPWSDEREELPPVNVNPDKTDEKKWYQRLPWMR